MIGEECKFLHPAPCKKYMENPERSCRAQSRGYHPELCKYSRATMECYNDSASEYISRAQGASKPYLRPRNKLQLPKQQINHKLWSPNKIWLTLPTQHTTAPSPTDYHTTPATKYLTTHQTTVSLYSNPPPLHASYNQPILNSYLIPSSSSNICTRIPNTLSYFSLHRHPTSIPHPTPQYPGWVPANDTKGHNYEWP